MRHISVLPPLHKAKWSCCQIRQVFTEGACCEMAAAAHRNPKPEEQHDEREPPSFGLDEPTKTPQFFPLSAVSRCPASGFSKAITCGLCKRCLVEQKLTCLTGYLKQVSPAWETEFFLCFATSLSSTVGQWLMDLLKPLVNPTSPTTDDVKMRIIEDGLTGANPGVMVRKNRPYEQIHVLLQNVENLVEWFEGADLSSQAIFLLRFLLLLEYSSVLRICVELEQLKTSRSEATKRSYVSGIEIGMDISLLFHLLLLELAWAEWFSKCNILLRGLADDMNFRLGSKQII